MRHAIDSITPDGWILISGAAAIVVVFVSILIAWRLDKKPVRPRPERPEHKHERRKRK